MPGSGTVLGVSYYGLVITSVTQEMPHASRVFRFFPSLCLSPGVEQQEVEGLPSPEAACLARGAPSVRRVGCLSGLVHTGGHDCGAGLLRSSPSTCSLRPEGAVMSSSRAADSGGVPLGTGGTRLVHRRRSPGEPCFNYHGHGRKTTVACWKKRSKGGCS